MEWVGGLNFLEYGILLQKKVNEFAYSKALLLFIEDFDFFKNNTNMDIYFKQDGSTPYTSQSNQFLIKNYLEIVSLCGKRYIKK